MTSPLADPSAARIRTRGENRMTGMTKHSPRTDLVELVALSRGAPGELSSPLASLSLLSASSASRRRCSLPSRTPVRLPEALRVGQAEPTANRQGARRSWAAAGIQPLRDSQRRLAASTNRDRGKTPRTRQGRVRLLRLGDNPHFAGYSAAAHGRANTWCVPTSTLSLVALAGQWFKLPSQLTGRRRRQ